MNNSTSPAVDWGDDSAGEMDSEDAAPSSSMGISIAIGSMMETSTDCRRRFFARPDPFRQLGVVYEPTYFQGSTSHPSPCTCFYVAALVVFNCQLRS
ncbi:hypothetical protein ACJX0J_020002, partial [Zea mays]